MSTVDEDPDLIPSLIANPERNFTRLLFELSPIASIETLADLVLHPDGGHSATIRCLCVWQDLQGYEFAFSSVLEEIKNAESVDTFKLCLELVNRLLNYSPDNLIKIRMLRELDEIRFEEHLRDQCTRFSSAQVSDCIEKFTLLSRKSTVPLVTHIPVVDIHRRATDADSGTFSSEEDDPMPSTVENGQINGKQNSKSQLENSEAFNEVNKLITEIASPDALSLLVDLLRELRNTEDSPTKLLKQLNTEFNRWTQKSTTKPVNPPAAPPPPPLINIVPKAPSLQPPGQKPPPPPSFGPLTVRPKIKTEIPAALKPKVLPPDGKKLRQLQWTKIPLNSLASANAVNSSNIWLQMDSLGGEFVGKLDFSVLDNHFACETQTEVQSAVAIEKESKQQTVSLLCAKRSLSVNVFLKSFKGLDELINYIRQGNSDEEGGLERLRMLVPLLPTEEECQTLRNYTGNRAELGTAEQFLLLLLGVPDYSLRIESIILREEFSALVRTIEPDLRTLIIACKELRQSKNLRTILLILLHMGNYLNHGGGLGNAVAFKLSSLWKIDELRAIKGGRTLLHLVAQQSEQTGVNLDDVAHVDEAAKVPFESLKNEVKTSTERVKRLSEQLKQKTSDTFFAEIRTFLNDANQQMNDSNKLLTELDEERRRLAVYFCENEKTFSLEECFKIFSNFRSRFTIASTENHQREEREKRSQERNTVLPTSTAQAPSSPRSPAGSVASLSPGAIRHSSVVIEQDRDRNSLPQVIGLRRKSSARRESAIFDNLSGVENDGKTETTGDLSSFVDRALEFNRRRSSRMSTNSILPSVVEFRDTENRETEEVRVPVPTLDSRLVDVPSSVRVSSETIKETSRRPLTAEENKEPKAVRKISEPIGPRSTPTNSRLTTSNKKVATNLYAKTSPLSSRKTATTERTAPSTSSNYKSDSTASKSDVNNTTPTLKATLRKVPAPLQKPLVGNTNQTETIASPLRKNVLGRVRARQSNEPNATNNSTFKPATPTTPPLRPSQIRAAQTRNSSAARTPPNAHSSVASSSPLIATQTSTLPKRPTTSTPSTPTGRSSTASTPLATRKVSSERPPISKNSVASPRTPISSGRNGTTSSRPTPSRTPMSAAEKRSLFKQNSVSTASRPSLIKTGSTTERPRWF
ncbi:FH2 domain-containing protein 1 [Aphelenchoides besseyi]|nr:FH2 domain-containing protein 1 [Aphelenchoides besseyi]KAI6235452.1 FH2 domain-containing protein 1 [Aphelenchoides besseyi]